MNKLEDMIAASKLNELLHKKEDDKAKNTLLWVLAIVGAVAAIAGIAFAVYKFFTPDYLEDFEEDFEDDFDDDFFSDDDEIQEAEDGSNAMVTAVLNSIKRGDYI